MTHPDLNNATLLGLFREYELYKRGHAYLALDTDTCNQEGPLFATMVEMINHLAAVNPYVQA